MNKRKTTKKHERVFADDERKLQLAKDITRLRRYTADEIAAIFGTSRQLINHHMKKEAKRE